MDRQDTDSAISVAISHDGPLKEGRPPGEGALPATGLDSSPPNVDTKAASESHSAATSQAPSVPTADLSRAQQEQQAQHVSIPQPTLTADPETSVPKSFVPSLAGGSTMTPESSIPEASVQSAPPPGPATSEGISGTAPEDPEALEALEDLEAAQQVVEGSSIVVDQDDVATDAGYGSDTRTAASTSLASSVRDYAFENGRRYHKFREGRYNFPNDDVEQEREDMKHAMVKLLCQQLHFAPIGDNPQQILDIGTGTGIWAIESEFITSPLPSLPSLPCGTDHLEGTTDIRGVY